MYGGCKQRDEFIALIPCSDPSLNMLEEYFWDLWDFIEMFISDFVAKNE